MATSRARSRSVLQPLRELLRGHRSRPLSSHATTCAPARNGDEQTLAFPFAHEVRGAGASRLFADLVHVERPVAARARFILANRSGEVGVARFADDGHDEPHRHVAHQRSAHGDARRQRRALRIDAAQPVHRGDAADRQHVRRRAHVDLVLLRQLEHVGEAPAHDVGEPLVDRLFRPEVAAAILHPLEVRDRDAAGVGENVRE